MRIIEINFLPFLKTRFPDQTEYIDTGFTFTGTGGLAARMRQAAGQFARLLRLTLNGRCDLVFCRCMGRFVYRRDASLLSNALRWVMGWCILLCVGALVRRGARLGVVDRTDETTIDPRDLFLLRRCTRYYKRELPSNAWNTLTRFLRGRHRELIDLTRLPSLNGHVDKFASFSLGIAPERCRQIEEALGSAPDPGDKRYDVFFSGYLGYSTVRTGGQRQLEALRARGYRVEFCAGRLPYAEFVEKMRASWLVWSPEGVGWDCYRHYEAPVAWSIPLINHPTIRRHAPLLHGVHCIEYGIEDDDLCRQAEAALADKARLWQMTQAARAHVLCFHTYAALGEYLLGALVGENDPMLSPRQAEGVLDAIR